MQLQAPSFSALETPNRCMGPWGSAPNSKPPCGLLETHRKSLVLCLNVVSGSISATYIPLATPKYSKSCNGAHAANSLLYRRQHSTCEVRDHRTALQPRLQLHERCITLSPRGTQNIGHPHAQQAPGPVTRTLEVVQCVLAGGRGGCARSSAVTTTSSPGPRRTCPRRPTPAPRWLC